MIQFFWYFSAGKTATAINYFSFRDLTLYGENSYFFHTFSGWFFIEHIFEEYNSTAGKFFLINKNFRTLVKNLLLLNRNILFWPQISKMTEFLLIIFLLSLFFYCFFHLILENQVTKKKEILLLLYYSTILYVLLLKIFIFFNWFNICFTLKLMLVFFIIFFSVLFAILQTIIFYNYWLINLKNLKFKSIFLKKYFYALIIVFLFFNHCELTFFIHLNNNNFIQEFFIQILLPYTYLYNLCII